MAHHNDLGKWGEAVVKEYLVTRGYAIVEENWKLHHLEVDLIASKDNIIVFVEVKTRKADGFDPLEAITPSKIRRLATAAHHYIISKRLPLFARFDVASVIGDEHSYTLNYIPNAFRAPLRTYR